MIVDLDEHRRRKQALRVVNEIYARRARRMLTQGAWLAIIIGSLLGAIAILWQVW